MLQYLKSLLTPSGAPSPNAGANDESAYQARVNAELRAFNECPNVHDLPEIFHYWSNKHLAPAKFHPFGITDPEQFFFLYVKKYHERFPAQFLHLVSLGCGNCDMEARLARRLVDANIVAFSIDCIDINETMLIRGTEHAKSLDVERHLSMQQGDFNDWKPRKAYDVVLANQCLHHVLNLEGLFAQIKAALVDEGSFLVSDMIGRNGHQRWPEALEIVQTFWKELPEKYRYNQLMKRLEIEYINHDCSSESFEGIRAQDILPLLTEQFHFELFIPFANVVLTFIDRPFGHNFDATAAWDRDFIDRLHARDEEGLLSGELTPTQMVAVLCKNPVTPLLVHPRLTPQFCIRNPAQRAGVEPPNDTKGMKPHAPETINGIDSAFAGYAPGHFYSPVVDVNYLRNNKDRVWNENNAVLGIEFNDESQINILKNAIKSNIKDYNYPDALNENEDRIGFYHNNGLFSWLDSRALFGILLYKKPKRVIEIGSGYSSLLIADVNSRLSGNSIEFTCIEPYPREFLKNGVPGLSSLIVDKAENVSIDLFKALQEDDILFVDSSHVSKTGSDVNYIIFEILPRLNPGVIMHFHDIFLPDEYPQDWVLNEHRSWNEQYLLRALLMYTNKFRVLFSSTYAYKKYPSLVREALSLPNGDAYGGCSFWMQKTD